MLPPLFSLKKLSNAICIRGKGEFSMTYTEEYQEHIQYTHDAFCKIVIRHAAIDMALRLRKQWGKEDNDSEQNKPRKNVQISAGF